MRKANYHKLKMKVANNSYIGESIETTMQRATETGEPVESSSPIIFTARKDGVIAQYDIRTDRWDIAQDAMDKVNAAATARRNDWIRNTETTTQTNNTTNNNTENNHTA